MRYSHGTTEAVLEAYPLEEDFVWFGTVKPAEESVQERVERIVREYVAAQNVERRGYELRGDFEVERANMGYVWLRRANGDVFGPLVVPIDATEIVKPGWRLKGVMQLTRTGWWLLDLRSLRP